LLVDPESVDELGEALTRLTTDSALRQDLAGRGRTRAAQFAWTTAVERTWAVYDELRTIAI
jgi:glycosyltransferase involved in cell wall biosynthesis